MVYAKVRKALQEGRITPRTKLIESRPAAPAWRWRSRARCSGSRSRSTPIRPCRARSGRASWARRGLVVHPSRPPVDDLLDAGAPSVRDERLLASRAVRAGSTTAAYEDLGREARAQLRARTRLRTVRLPGRHRRTHPGLGTLAEAPFPGLRSSRSSRRPAQRSRHQEHGALPPRRTILTTPIPGRVVRVSVRRSGGAWRESRWAKARRPRWSWPAGGNGAPS
jgi:hypothetical protein